ncbi:HlyD family efflux transporter periplasmic adaptor subunit [bacterium]|nr:MAG: HlyD family efflux transporter periplasmic adaptor subunit [bacterium]
MLLRAGLGALFLVAALAFVPWQQNVVGTGEVAIFSAMDRPQNVEAQIPGRIVKWHVQEGQTVKEGDPIAEIEDIDSKFLDEAQPERLSEQRDLAQLGRSQAEGRVVELEDQRASLDAARTDALGVARQAIAQTDGRVRAAREALRQTEQNQKIAVKVAIAAARERAGQAKERIAQAEQTLQAAENQAQTMRLRRARISGLFAEGLRSRQDDEFAQNDLVKAETDVVRARTALDIARRDYRVGNLAQDQAGLESERADAVVAQARANVEVAEKDAVSARLNLSRLQSDTAAGLSRVGADIQAARESLAKSASEVRKVENELGNLRARTGQQSIRAPRTGRIVRLNKVGPGTTVKAGDVLATIAPDTKDRVVELILSDNDVPLVRPGRPVRLQFAGWPALQVGGMPGVAVGTFGGRVAFIDPVDDGKSRYRVVIRPDRQRLPGGRLDEAWPDPNLLRPGTEAFGWVMLDRVPLGWELWRQLNGFPPRVPTAKEKDRTLGPVKVKGK